MIKFLWKGIIRDKNRSLLPVIIISIGVTLTVFLSGYMAGAFGDIIGQNARFETGHVKIMSRSYAENKAQLPNDLALLGVDTLTQTLQETYPDMDWVKRIRFGGLLDVPGKDGNTIAQGPASGMALELFSEKSGELERMNITSSLVKGRVPKQSGEAIIADEFAEKLKLSLGDTVTYVGSTMNGSMAFENFTISGTIRFGTSSLDKGAIIIDISDAQRMMDMENGAGEILGYFKNGVYVQENAAEVKNRFNKKYQTSDDPFAPEMFTLEEQNNLKSMLEYADSMTSLIVGVLIFAMSIVLWNTGLLGGLRRYKEYGIRLALGEAKGKIYRSIVLEALLIGIIGSVVGTVLGLGATYWMQVVGIDISGFMDESSMMMPSTMRAKMTFSQLYIGFIPGVFAMVLGNMLSGIGIYKRETATLFKELEV